MAGDDRGDAYKVGVSLGILELPLLASGGILNEGQHEWMQRSLQSGRYVDPVADAATITPAI